MLGEIVKRGVNLLVAVLAALAFFTVPLGERTLYEHCVAIVSTKEARALGDGAKRASAQIEQQVKAQH